MHERGLVQNRGVTVPRYFFDTDDGTGLVVDEDGQELSGPDQLRYLALDALPDIARDIIPDGDERLLSVRVRDETGAYVFEAFLSLKTRWLTRSDPL